ncbi:DUF885 family protein [Sphingomonas naphthae]|uniref:DUF885 family protein n=1 Tax=Sphingomonas naphthae TaxID=1813468 RepID=A0ABY7TPX4_9SPHN|nr:DUF885 family protein [Sphingomonas naphthae]WCT74741.1 DUF885 family protein [Sphingomonas naphthae]
MTALSRRGLLVAGGAMALLPARLRAATGDAGAALDAAAVEADPVRALALLKGVTGGTPALALDLEAARAGLAIDAALATAAPADRFALLLRRAAGDGLDPVSTEARLTAELAALHRRADALFTQIGDTQGDIGARYRRLWGDTRYLYTDDEAGRARAIADMTRMLDAARARLPRAFAGLPRWCGDVDVRVLSAEEIAAGKGGYRTLPTATSRGAYVVDLKDIRRRPSWTLPSVVTHELVPGHMVQLPVEAIEPPHPLRLRYTPVFAEGWATYAEQLSAAQGAFAGDPRIELGHIHWLLFRATRGLVDIGIHRHGWTIDQARARLIAWMGEPAYFAPFDTDLARIAREPAFRAAEAMAWLAIADAARGLTGTALVRFHAAMLAHGRKRIEAFPREPRR